MSDQTVTVYIVQADTTAGSGKPQTHDLGMYFMAADADKHIASLSTESWSNARRADRAVALRDIHPAHVSMLTKAQQATWATLQPITVK